jgi:hypothetical protein
MTVRPPTKDDKRVSDHQLVTKYSSGLVGLDCEFEVVAGTFEGSTIWENLFFRPQFQSISLTKGQEGICNGSDAKFRAIIEAARGIDPMDGSPAAVNARSIQDWGDFTGMEFPVMVGVAKVRPGDQFINNTVVRVITPDRPEYAEIMAGGEIITDTPLPELHHGGTSTTKPASGGYQPPAQNGGGYQPPGGGQQTQQGGQQGGQKPAWAK